MSRSEIASMYRISTKTFSKQLRRNDLNFGANRVLSPKQIKQVIEALGHWAEVLDIT